ncbi:10047_t:CDS:2, partial [Dentiscutata erythropus]
CCSGIEGGVAKPCEFAGEPQTIYGVERREQGIKSVAEDIDVLEKFMDELKSNPKVELLHDNVSGSSNTSWRGLIMDNCVTKLSNFELNHTIQAVSADIRDFSEIVIWLAPEKCVMKSGTKQQSSE